MEQRLSTSRIPVIAILDIGKTNKKIFLFNEQYKIIYERSTQLAETTDDDGFPCENVRALTNWVTEEIGWARHLERTDIKAINFSAYGASFVHIDGKGKPVGHLSNYLKPFPEPLLHSFLTDYDPGNALSLRTSSPQLGSLNSGLQLFRLKHERPEFYERVKYSLHLPQFISYLLSGQPFSELTSLGCHTMLWNFKEGNYHQWVVKEGIESKFPGITSSSHVTSVGATKIGVGLHDSSAALIPYLKTFQDPFVLISTGTWCISLNPFNQHPLTQDELDADCLQYISYEGKPVKASRLFSGYEHDQMVKKIAAYFNVAVKKVNAIKFDNEVAAALINAQLEAATHRNKTGQRSSGFDGRALSQFGSVSEAYHQLLIDIVRLQVHSTSLVLEDTKIRKIYVDGGFSTNSIFMNLLAAALPQYEIFGTSMPQASAIGAALAIHHAWNNQPLPKEIISLRSFPKPEGVDIPLRQQK